MKSKISVIMTVVVIILLIALSFFLGFKYINERETVTALNSKVESLEGENEKLNQQISVANEKEEKDNVEVSKNNLVKLDLSKLNYDSNVWEQVSNISFDEQNGVQAIIEKDNTILIRTDGSRGESVNYLIENLDKNAIKVTASTTFVDNRLVDRLYFLMEDGTIKYINSAEVYASSKTLHDLDGVSNVVDIRKTLASKTNGGGTIVTVAIKSDGSSVII